MNKNDFIKEVSKKIKRTPIDKLETIIIEICKDIPEGYYYKTLCRINNLENDDENLINDIEKEVNEMLRNFKKLNF